MFAMEVTDSRLPADVVMGGTAEKTIRKLGLGNGPSSTEGSQCYITHCITFFSWKIN